MPEDLPNSPAQQARLRAVAHGGTIGRLTRCVTAGLDLRGEVDLAALQAGVDHVLRRRPALRSGFQAGRDRHRIAGYASIPVRHLVVAADTPAQRWQAAHDQARAEAHRPFPTGQIPLLRATLFDAGARQLLLLKMDQLVCDAWSANLIVDDLVAAADRWARGLPPAPAEADEYAQVRQARAAWVGGAAGQAAIARRRAALAGHSLTWPLADRPPPGGQLVEEVLDLDPAAGSAFLSRLRSTGGSVLGAAALALAQAVLDPADRVALTTVFAGREDRVEEGVVGWFANRVAVPLPPLTGTVAEALLALRARLAGALNDQGAPHPLVAAQPRAEDAPAGKTVSLMYLPAQLSTGAAGAVPIGATGTATRAGISICPTGADIDLYLVESTAQVDGRRQTRLRIGAISGAGGLDRPALADLLRRWADTIVHFSQLDWRAEQLAGRRSR